MEGGELPIDNKQYSGGTETIGATIKFPKDKEKGLVIKAGKDSYSSVPVTKAQKHIEDVRERERIGFRVASEKTKSAMVPQEYVLAEGDQPGEARTMRVQKFVEGTPLRKLGFKKIMNLDPENLDTLKSIVKDSIRCYLHTGLNFDIGGSDEREAKNRPFILALKRTVFPLSSSNNLLLTDNGIKLIDPNIYGDPGKELVPKYILAQWLLFAASVFDYGLLSVAQLVHRKHQTLAAEY